MKSPVHKCHMWTSIHAENHIRYQWNTWEQLFWPTVWKNCSSDQEKLLKFKAEGQEFAKFLRSPE